MSNVVTGTLLRDTSPVGIEKYLVEKVRNELGDFHDLATIRPVLRIDTEDGDLSGNVENGFGTVMLDVSGKTIHLPFIIHKKQLLPFDVIRMGGQEVVYDLSKLRKIVVGIDKEVKDGEGEGSSRDVMSVVDSRDISTQNGFLGTIMSIRDSHRDRDINGMSPYEGDDFGTVDDNRVEKRASEEIDVAESFESFHEKLAEVLVFSKDDVKKVVAKVEEKEALDAKDTMEAASDIASSTKESILVRRNFDTLDKTQLANVKRSASGNNIKFPMFDNTQFEYRNGRVYHDVKSSLVNKRSFTSGVKSDVSRIVIDSKGQYALLSGKDDFMITTEQPSEFSIPTQEASAFVTGDMYAFELSTQSISQPFVISRQYLEEEENNGILVSVPEKMDKHRVLKASQSSLFRNSFSCLENGVPFVLITLKNSTDGLLKKVSPQEVEDFITQHAVDSTDLLASKMISNRFSSKEQDVYFISESKTAFKFKKRIPGHFTKLDGLFKEGPFMHKEASYNQANKARLYINEQSKPTTYSVEWSYANEEDIEGNEAFNIKKERLDDLAPAQAKKILQDLGFDHGKQQLFFEISKRNGRFAEFALPDKETAKNITPKEKSMSKAKQAIRNIANSTLNAGNFVPVLENVMADVGGEYITSIAPGSTDWINNIKDKVASSQDTAVAFEKTASTVRGSAWSEVAYVLNIKHHMDKLAMDITNGFVKDAEPVFSEVQRLEPVVEKIASSLLEFNRDQQLRTNAPIINPGLVKEALAELDGLSGYIETGKQLEKKSFFHKGTRKKIDELSKTLKGLSDNSTKFGNELKERSTDMRVLERKNLTDTDEAKKVIDGFNSAKESFVNNAKKISENVSSQEKLNQEMQKKNRIAMAGVGLPGIAALSFSHQSSKE